MSLKRPGCFGDLSWWTGAVGVEVARNVRPFGIDEHDVLQVACRSAAWRLQAAVLAPQLLAVAGRRLPSGAVVAALAADPWQQAPVPGVPPGTGAQYHRCRAR
ncbi:DciA family protein [Kitasatospora paranensis]|uniref:DciA family protein n=1 Tax=Kitasatospora paranensis TaxID=258053 RepID=A0ABW2FZX4_9ACTN